MAAHWRDSRPQLRNCTTIISEATVDTVTRVVICQSLSCEQLRVGEEVSSPGSRTKHSTSQAIGANKAALGSQIAKMFSGNMTYVCVNGKPRSRAEYHEQGIQILGRLFNVRLNRFTLKKSAQPTPSLLGLCKTTQGSIIINAALSKLHDLSPGKQTIQLQNDNQKQTIKVPTQAQDPGPRQTQQEKKCVT